MFEALRRNCPHISKTALLSGSLVILPSSAIDAVSAIAREEGVECKIQPVQNTEHCEVTFGGSNKNKVLIITRLFGDGLINVLIGTKSLLGEGWDSPNINSLILASFVGSCMLSNQMRGRAIRIDKKKPDKISNIWHLVTVDPTADIKDKLAGEDFATLERRFACFQAPAYNSDVVESGIDRLDKDTIAICALLHDLGKVGDHSKQMYIENVFKSGKVSATKPYKRNPGLSQCHTLFVASSLLNAISSYLKAKNGLSYVTTACTTL